MGRHCLWTVECTPATGHFDCFYRPRQAKMLSCTLQAGVPTSLKGIQPGLHHSSILPCAPRFCNFDTVQDMQMFWTSILYEWGGWRVWHDCLQRGSEGHSSPTRTPSTARSSATCSRAAVSCNALMMLRAPPSHGLGEQLPFIPRLSSAASTALQCTRSCSILHSPASRSVQSAARCNLAESSDELMMLDPSRSRGGSRADAVTSIERCPNPQMGPSRHPDIEAFITSMCNQACPHHPSLSAGNVHVSPDTVQACCIQFIGMFFDADMD